jgi:hypothetical protein
VRDALTSHEYNDVTGAVTVNVTDALLAIAHAIDRLAIAHENSMARAELAQARIEAMIAPTEGRA